MGIVKPDIKVFCWGGTLGVAGLTKTAFAFNNTDETAGAAQADLDTPTLLGEEPGFRALIIAGTGAFGAFSKVNPDLPGLFSDGPFLTDPVMFYTDYFTQLAANGASPDYMMIDLEGGGYGTSAIFSGPPIGTVRQDLMQTIVDDPDAWANVPIWLQTDWLANPTAWNSNAFSTLLRQYKRWSNSRDQDVVRQFVVEPAIAAAGVEPVCVNYQNKRHSWESLDKHKWPNASKSVTGHSAPVMYGDKGGNYFNILGLTKVNRWNAYLNEMDNFLSCVQANRGRVMPWISTLTYNGNPANQSGSYTESPWLMRQMIKQIVSVLSTQIQQPDSPTDEIMIQLFNPTAAPIDRDAEIAALAAVIQDANDAEINTTREVFTSDTVNIDGENLNVGGLDVTYADFLANQP